MGNWNDREIGGLIMDFISKDKALKTALTAKITAAIEDMDFKPLVTRGIRNLITAAFDEDYELTEEMAKAISKTVMAKLHVTFNS